MKHKLFDFSFSDGITKRMKKFIHSITDKKRSQPPNSEFNEEKNSKISKIDNKTSYYISENVFEVTKSELIQSPLKISPSNSNSSSTYNSLHSQPIFTLSSFSLFYCGHEKITQNILNHCKAFYQKPVCEWVSSSSTEKNNSQSQKRRPLVLALFGPPGCGKTFLAEQLSLYCTSQPPIILHCNTFIHAYTMSDILGPAKGLEGHGSPTPLHSLLKNPCRLILLDEFEKAHPEIWQIFMHIFDRNQLLLNDGSCIPFDSAIFVLTMNLGKQVTSDNIYYHINHIPSPFSNEFLKFKNIPGLLDRIFCFYALSSFTISSIKNIIINILQNLQKTLFEQRKLVFVWNDHSINILMQIVSKYNNSLRKLPNISQLCCEKINKAAYLKQIEEGDYILLADYDDDYGPSLYFLQGNKLDQSVSISSRSSPTISHTINTVSPNNNSSKIFTPISPYDSSLSVSPTPLPTIDHKQLNNHFSDPQQHDLDEPSNELSPSPLTKQYSPQNKYQFQSPAQDQISEPKYDILTSTSPSPHYSLAFSLNWSISLLLFIMTFWLPVHLLRYIVLIFCFLQIYLGFNIIFNTISNGLKKISTFSLSLFLKYKYYFPIITLSFVIILVFSFYFFYY